MASVVGTRVHAAMELDAVAVEMGDPGVDDGADVGWTAEELVGVADDAEGVAGVAAQPVASRATNNVAAIRPIETDLTMRARRPDR